MLFKNMRRMIRLNEAITSNGQPLQSPDDDPNSPPEEVPDFSEGEDTGDGDQQDPNAAGGDQQDPNAAGGDQQDPNAAGGDPNDPNAAGGDPNDPNAAGGEDDQPPDADGDAKSLEADLFSKLTPEQIVVKNKELKTQYVSMYEAIDKTIERLSKAQRKEYTIKPLNFVVKKLLDLRDLLKDYLVDQFDNKSYVENQITLQRNMAIYLILTKIIEELNKASLSTMDKNVENRIIPSSLDKHRRKMVLNMRKNGMRPEDPDEG